MGWYRVVKTVKGHRYLYEQRSWREGKKVQTESRYIGPAGGTGAGDSAAVITTDQHNVLQAGLSDTAQTFLENTKRRVPNSMKDY